EVDPATGLAVVPSNCDSVTVTIVVSNPFDAVADVFPTQTPSTTAPTTVGNVTANDTLNGVPVTADNSDVTPVTAGPLSIDADGVLTLAPNTPSGSYSITYTICEVNPVTGLAVVPSNCDSVTVTIVVSNPIDAVADRPPAVLPGANVPSVIANDTLNGIPVVIGTAPGNVTLSSTPTGPLTMNPDGTITVAPNTPAGSYSIAYTICEVSNRSNCSTTTVTVTVTAPAIAAVADTATTLPGTNTPSVITNDTLNGVPVVIGTAPGNVTLSSTPTGPLTMNPDGTIAVAPNTPAGDYLIDYTICEVNNPSICKTTTVTVTVTAPPMTAVADATTALPGTNTPSVIGNDTLNGVRVVIGTAPGNVTLSSTPTGPLTMNPDGTIAVAPNTPAGVYSINYTICEVSSQGNCKTTTATVTVSASVLLANNDNDNGRAAEFTINGFTGGKVADIIGNDTLNGVALTPAMVNVSFVSSTNAGITLSGIDVIVAPGTPAGTYTLRYAVCDKVNPSNCEEALVTIIVTSECEIKVYNSVTADGSGMYDRFVIQGIECYPNNSVQIFNRWGVLVFEREHYNNDDVAFRGISEGRVTFEKSQELPVGNYFYILKYKDSNSNAFEKSGYLYLNRR
ncbi:gliding motility-associated C-terminal domain-containing protein, partial [Flavobacterium granuli]